MSSEGKEDFNLDKETERLVGVEKDVKKHLEILSRKLAQLDKLKKEKPDYFVQQELDRINRIKELDSQTEADASNNTISLDEELSRVQSLSNEISYILTLAKNRNVSEEKDYRAGKKSKVSKKPPGGNVLKEAPAPAKSKPAPRPDKEGRKAGVKAEKVSPDKKFQILAEELDGLVQEAEVLNEGNPDYFTQEEKENYKKIIGVAKNPEISSGRLLDLTANLRSLLDKAHGAWEKKARTANEDVVKEETGSKGLNSAESAPGKNIGPRMRDGGEPIKPEEIPDGGLSEKEDRIEAIGQTARITPPEEIQAKNGNNTSEFKDFGRATRGILSEEEMREMVEAEKKQKGRTVIPVSSQDRKKFDRESYEITQRILEKDSAGRDKTEPEEAASPPAEAPKISPVEAEPTSRELFLRNLGEKRHLFIEGERAKKEWVQGNKLEGKEEIEEKLNKAKEEYEKALSSYGFQLRLDKIKELEEKGIKEESNEFALEMAVFNGELFKELIEDEQDSLAVLKISGLKPREQSFARKMYGWYASKPLWAKAIISTGLLTGSMVAGGAVAGGAAALVFGAQKLARGLLSGGLAAGSAGLVKAFGTKHIEEYDRKQRQIMEHLFDAKMLEGNSAEKFEEALLAMKEKSNEHVLELARKEKRVNIASGLTALAVGGATAGAMSYTGWGESLSNAVNEKFGILSSVKGAGKAVGSLDNEALAGKAAAEGVKAAAGAIETPAPFENISVVEVHEGDSVWKLAEKQLESRGYFKGLTGTPEDIMAKKTYMIDAIKDKIVEDPALAGLEDADMLRAGDKINFGEIFKEDFSGLAEEAQSLAPEQTENILNYEAAGEAAAGEEIPEQIVGGGEPAGGEIPEQTVSGKTAAEISDKHFGGESGSDVPEQHVGDSSPAAEKALLNDPAVRENYNKWVELNFEFSKSEAEAILKSQLTAGQLLSQIPEKHEEAWAIWRGEIAGRSINLPHDGLYGYKEFGKHIELADYIRRVAGENPSKEILNSKVGDLLEKQFLIRIKSQ